MPNWCDLDVTIVGDKETLEQVKAKGAEGTYEYRTNWDNEKREYKNVEVLPNLFSFNNFFPIPEFDEDKKVEKSLDATVAEWSKGRDGKFDNWYDWSIGNWGTKWDLRQGDDTQVTDITEREDGLFQFSIYSQTAWSPALNLFAKLTEDFPVKVIYRYADESMMFVGQAVVENGEIDDDCRDITPEVYEIAGATLDEDGEVDWDKTEGYDLYQVFDLEESSKR